MSAELDSAVGTLLVLLLLLLPGACAAAGFELHRVRYGRRRKDWLLRLTLASGLCLAVGAWPLHWLATTFWDRLVDLQPLPWPIYLVPIAYLALPTFLGWGVGFASNRYPKWSGRFLGTNRIPTAWDHLFETRAAGFLRCRLRSGRWVGGLYDNSATILSYASTDEEQQDIYIAHTVEFDDRTGAPMLRQGGYVWTGGGILLKWSEIESLEFVDVSGHA